MASKKTTDGAADTGIPNTLSGWIRTIKVRHLVALGAAVILFVLLDEFSGITPPFGRLRDFTERGLIQTAVYSGVGLTLSALAILVLRSRSLVLSLGALVLYTTATVLELAFDIFTGTGFSQGFVALSIRELGMAPEALKAYGDSRVLLAVVLGCGIWIGIWTLLRRRSLFGPLIPRRATLLCLAGLLALGGVWRLRIDHFRAFPLYVRPAYNVADYYVQQWSLPEREEPAVVLMDRPEVARRIVFLVDESVRPDYLSLQGFDRPTTPYLTSISQRLYDFGTAASGSTCSEASNRMLNSFVRPEDVEDRNAIESRPTIFYYAKRAGYRTVLLSGVFKSPLFYGIRKSDLPDIDETLMINLQHDGPKYLNDHLLVEELASLFDRHPDEKLFVYVRKQGTHFPFDDYYPPSEQHFLPPLGDLRPMQDHRPELLNSYLNGLRWNLDRFYEKLDTVMGDREAAYIYTSDHGEDVEFAGGELLHCGQFRTMATVPLWLDIRGQTTRTRIEEQFGADFAVRNRNHASHMNLFPTILALMNVETDRLTLFDDLTSQRRDYYPPGYQGAFWVFPFDSIP